jgi:hypothetical protein
VGTVFAYRGGWRFKFKDATDTWVTITSKAATKAQARSELQEKEIEVERQRLGLAPRTVNPERWTVADLLRWWLDEYSRHLASHDRNESAIRTHLLDAPLAAKKLEHVAATDIEGLLQSKQGDIGP